MPDKFVPFSGPGHRLGGSGQGNQTPTGQAHNVRQARAQHQPQNHSGSSATGHRLGGHGVGNQTLSGQAHNERQARALYQPQNITGFTGRIGHQPTVYYTSEDVHGHITQAHRVPENVGREMPIEHPGYSATNTGRNGALEERINGHLIHPSRNPLVGATATTQPSLANAHTQFPDLKPMTDPTVRREVKARLAAEKKNRKK